jgi:hypothetical protein
MPAKAVGQPACCGNPDEIVKRHLLQRLRKKTEVKARESRAARRIGGTPQRQQDQAQRRDWTF